MFRVPTDCISSSSLLNLQAREEGGPAAAETAFDGCLRLKSKLAAVRRCVPRFQRAGPGRVAGLPPMKCSIWGVPAGGSGEAGAAAAETAVDVCLGLKLNSQLWADVVPRFQRAGALGQLLGCLLPRIMSGQLQSLAPEVMQVPSQMLHLALLSDSLFTSSV